MTAAVPETDRKLEEAALFWRRMEAEDQKVVRNEPEVFGPYLSAFLSAGRSVTFVLQKESGGEERYRPWYDEWLSTRSDDERDLLTFMNDQRINEVHKTGTQTKIEIVSVPLIGMRSDPAYGYHVFQSPVLGVPQPQTIGVIKHYFDGRPEQTLVETCKRYLDLLNELVDAFKRH